MLAARTGLAQVMLAVAMPKPRVPDPLPIDAVRVPPGHRDVRRETSAAIPGRPAPLGKRLLWRVLLAVVRIPRAASLLKRFRSR
jgi:hypothetical protein